MNKHFLIVGNGSDYIKAMWKELIDQENVQYIDWFDEKKFGRRYNLLKKAQYYHKTFYYTKHSGKRIWSGEYNQKFTKLEEDNIVIFTDLFPLLYDGNFVNKLHKKATIVVFLINTCWSYFKTDNKHYISKIFNRLGVDKIYSFDKDDCEKYGLEYAENIYSVNSKEENSIKKYDCYFVGQNKGRLETIISVADQLDKVGKTYLFRITGVECTEKLEERTGFILNKEISYAEVLNEIALTDTILDIPMNGQKGLSLRYFESVCYNKKLITYNMSTKSQCFYKPEYILAINNAHQITREFFENSKDVDYKYDGRYSPVTFVKKEFNDNGN